MHPLTELALTACTAGVSYGLYTLCSGAISYLQELTSLAESRRLSVETDHASNEESRERFIASQEILYLPHRATLEGDVERISIKSDDVKSFRLVNFWQPENHLRECYIRLAYRDEVAILRGKEDIEEFFTFIGYEHSQAN